MKLLLLTNFFPPAGNGGYEEWCQEVAVGLRSRGHEVLVLTSLNGVGKINADDPPWVHRKLHLEMPFSSLIHGIQFFTHRKINEERNLDYLRRMIREQAPDLIFVWGMWNLSRSLPELAEALMPGRVVYYLADYWPTLPSQHKFYWQAPAQNWLTQWPKRILRPFAEAILSKQVQPKLNFAHVLFPSHFMEGEMRRQGFEMGETRVVYGAIDTSQYSNGSHPARKAHTQPGRLSLLYAGRLAREKGVDTAIYAMKKLVHEHYKREVHLTIAGGGESVIAARLRQMVIEAGLEEYITFIGSVPKEKMPELYRQHDVFLFTSTWQEPFGRVIVESMASGTLVVGTATGGAGEIMQAGRNALVYDPHDPNGLVTQVLRLVEHPELRTRLVQAGRRDALEKYDIQRMVTEIEVYLESLLERVGLEKMAVYP